MKILLLTTHLDIGGITSYLAIVATGLKARGHDVIIASSGGIMAEMFITQGIPHVMLPLRTKSELHPAVLVSAGRLRKFLQDHPVDLIHAQTRVAQVVAQLLRWRTGVPFLSTWHGFFRPHVGRRLFPCVGEQVIAISPPVQQHLLQAFRMPPTRVTLIEHGIPFEHFQAPSRERKRTLRQEFGFAEEAFVVGTVARLVPSKGIDRLLRALAHVVPTVPRLHGLIVGSGPAEARLRALTHRLGLTQRVVFFGSQADLIAPLSVMDCFVLPILGHEGFGLVLLEAMAMELPVIATMQPALRHVLAEGHAGILVPPGDVAALGQAIRQLATQPVLAEQMALRGYAHVREAYSATRMLDQLERVYQQVVRTHHAAIASRQP